MGYDMINEIMVTYMWCVVVLVLVSGCHYC